MTTVGAADEEGLRGVAEWHLDVLGYRELVRCDVDELADPLDDLFGHLATTGPMPGGGGDADVVVAREGSQVVVRTRDGSTSLSDTAAAVDHVQWLVNQRVIENVHRRATGLHAAAAQHDGATVVMPAVSGAGKSTLVTGLVRRGWRYLTDEAVELGAGTDVRCYPKAVTLDPGAHPLFHGLRPPGRSTRSWYVPPHRIGAVGTDGWAVATHVVLPRWSPSSEPTAVRLNPAAAVMALAPCTFYFNSDGPRHLVRLAELVRSVAVWQVEFPDVETGVTLVGDVCSRHHPVAERAVPDVDPVPHGQTAEVFDDGAVVFAPADGSLHHLDPVAYHLWCRLSEDAADAVVDAATSGLPSDVVGSARESIYGLERHLRRLRLLRPPECAPARQT